MTKTIKKALLELGEQNKYYVMPNEDEGQFLFDLIWFEIDKDNNLIDVHLVVESELDYNKAKFDFEKLLLANARHKLFISMGGLKNQKYQIKKMVDSFKNEIENFRLCKKGERYLFAIYDWENTEFNFYLSIKP